MRVIPLTSIMGRYRRLRNASRYERLVRPVRRVAGLDLELDAAGPLAAEVPWAWEAR